MIKILLLASYMVLSFHGQVFAQKPLNICPGSCNNTSENKIYDGLCFGAGQSGGRTQCERYTNFGCVWTQKQQVIYPGKCVNQGGNSQYDALCIASGQSRGQKGCHKYAAFGCVWYAEQIYCQ